MSILIFHNYTFYLEHYDMIDSNSSMLEALSNNVNGNISWSLINLCNYIAEFNEEEYISAAGFFISWLEAKK